MLIEKMLDIDARNCAYPTCTLLRLMISPRMGIQTIRLEVITEKFLSSQDTTRRIEVYSEED